MPYDSNGNASINRNRAVTGQTVQAAQVNTPFDDVQSMLSQVLLRSGVAPMTGALNMNGFRVTGAGEASSSGDLVTLSQVQAVFNDPYGLQPIGMPLPLNIGMAGFSPPPKNKSYRYIILTAGQTTTGLYNEGLLTGESVSGTSPDIVATATISLPGSPLNGATVRLINTTREFLRPGSPGVAETSKIKSHSHGVIDGGHDHDINFNATGQQLQNGTNGQSAVVFNSSATSRVNSNISIQNFGQDETAPRSFGVDFYMRIL